MALLRTTSSQALLAAAIFLLAACGHPKDAPSAAPVAPRLANALTPVLSADWESGIPADWTAETTSGSCTWHVQNHPENNSVTSALNPSSVTLPDSGAHLPAKGGTHVVWFGEDSTGTYVGTPFTGGNNNGGSSDVVQAGTLTSPSVAIGAGSKALVEFDSWWEIEGVAGASFDKMIVQVSTNGSTWTQVGILNPTFDAGLGGNVGYTAGGAGAAPEWRHYAFDVSSYAGQSIQVRFDFNTGDEAYNGFRGWTIDNLSVGSGASLPAPSVTGVEPPAGTKDDQVAITGASFVQGATFWLGANQISANNIVQFGTEYVLFQVPGGLTAGTKYDVKVVNPDGQTSTLVKGFTYASASSPSISSVSPSTGTAGVAQSVTISGAHFVSGATVTVGAYDATGVTVTNASTITATFPAMPSGNYNVVVTNPSGQAGTKFTAYSIPAVVDSSTVTVTAPNGGESWATGTTHAITWTETGVTTARIDLYKGGSFDQTIATGVTASAGTYSWAIPAGLAAGTDYTVKVSNQLGANGDFSNASFSVTSAPAQVCGNGVREGTEACDDGGTANNDGCSSTCTVETGWSCPGGTACAPICGDGLKKGTEACDDGNTTPADGCSATCQVEPGYSCPTAGAACVAVCGDGILTAGEECDDGGTANGNGCSSTCHLEAGSTCFFTSPNLIQNGSFDQGSTGWTSAYTWTNPATVNAIYNEGTWSISADAHHLHSAIASGFKDAEGSASNMAAYFNGASTALDALTQSVNLTAGKTYVLSMYVTNWGGAGDSPYPKLSISVGGQVLTTDLSLSSSTWQRVGGTFVAASTGPAILKVVDSVTAGAGNDFAVDAVILREAAAQVCGQVCAIDADCADAGAGYWCDTTAVGHPPFCTPPLPPGTPIPTIPNRDPSDPPLDGTCTPANAGVACQSGACNPATSTCATATGACVTGAQCVSNVCAVSNLCVPQYTVKFQTDGTTGASLTGATTQTVLSGDGASAVTAVAPAAHNFSAWTGTGGFASTGTNPLTVASVTADLTITAHFAGVGSLTAVSGGSMSATVGSAYADQLCVEVRDTSGVLLAGAPVHLGVPGSGASASLTADLTSGEDGLACTSVTANHAAGSFVVSASGTGVTVPAIAALSNTAGPPASWTYADGAVAEQSTPVGQAYPHPLAVRLLDQYGNPVPAVVVTFAHHDDGGSGYQTQLSSASAATDTNGVAEVTASANHQSGWETFDLSATGLPLAVAFSLQADPGAPATLTVDSLSTPQTAQVGGHDFDAPLGLSVTDLWGNAVPGVVVSFAGPDTGARAALSSGTATTDTAGHAQVGATSGITAGTFTVTASVGSLTASFSLANAVGAPGAILVVAGDGQHASVDGGFASPLVVEVVDAYSNPVPGVLVSFQLSASAASATLSSNGLLTGSDGQASVIATPDVVAGALQVIASAQGVSSPVTFDLVLDPGAPHGVTVNALSDAQTAQVATPFQNPLAVVVRDAHGNPVPGVQVTFTVPDSDASAELSQSSATTGEDGTAGVAATANTVSGGYQVTATVEGLPPVTFGLTNQPGAPNLLAVTGGTPQEVAVDGDFTALRVVIRDQYGNPVPDVEVTFTAPGSGASAVLGSSTATTTGIGTAQVAASAGTVAGEYVVVATAPGVSAPVQFTLTNLPGAPAALVIGAGSTGQSTRVGDPFADPLTLTVVDSHGNPVPGVSVAFACPGSGATCTLDAPSSVTDGNGQATVHATAGSRPGDLEVVVTASGVPAGAFHLTNLVGLPGSLESTGGASQEAGVFTPFPDPLALVVRDAFGNVVPGVEVTFEVVTAGAQSATLSAPSALSDAGGLASVTATANSAKGSFTVRASASGVASPAEFSLTNTAIASTLTLDIQLPVFGTVISANGVSHLLATVGPNAGETPPTGTVRFRASRTIRLVPGQPGVSEDGDDIVATLVDGAVDVKVQVIGWRSRTLQVTYAPDAAAGATWDPVEKTVDLVADVPHQTHGGGGCSTGGGSLPLTALPLLLLALVFRRRRR
jgi:cysteine-rich repeat protein